MGSRGPAVTLLQVALLLTQKGDNQMLVPDGCFGRQTTNGVKALQIELALPITGKFCRETRRAFARKTGLDLEAIKADALRGS